MHPQLPLLHPSDRLWFCLCLVPSLIIIIIIIILVSIVLCLRALALEA